MTAETRTRQQAASDTLDVRPFSEVETKTITLPDNTPDAPNQYGSGTVAPAEAEITYHRYEDGRREVTARIKGAWRRPDGELTDAPLDQSYGNGPDADWPDWLAGLAWDYHPEPCRLPAAIPDRTPPRGPYAL